MTISIVFDITYQSLGECMIYSGRLKIIDLQSDLRESLVK